MNNDTIPVANRIMPEWVGFLIMLGAILLVALVAFFWALSVRKRKNRTRKYRQHHRRKGIREHFQKSATGIKALVRQQQGRHHRGHRTINPTLAQTGGLPPLRKDDEPPPPAPQP